jgi:hypothetical protein
MYKNSVEIHPYLNAKGHPVDGVLVATGSLGLNTTTLGIVD